MDVPDLPTVIGVNARRLRQDAGATLEQMAVAIRSYGMHWSTGRVGDLEAGRVSASLSTTISVALALSRLLGRNVPLAELAEFDGVIRINDGLTVRGATLVNALSGKDFQLRMADLPEAGERTGKAVRAMRAQFDLMGKLAERYGDVGFALIERAESTTGLAEERAAKDLGVTSGTLAHTAAFLWHRTFAEERSRRAGPNASPQKLGQVTRKMKAELRTALDEVRDGDDQ